MSQNIQKRKRSLNWDEEEKALLKCVLKDYAPIIENKCIKTNTNKSKLKAWSEVLRRFNEVNCRQRDLSQLQAQWKAMKMSAKKKVSNFRKEIVKTGGGTKPPSPPSEVYEVIDLLNPGELIVDCNKFDSDGIHITQVEDDGHLMKFEITEENKENQQDCNNVIVKDLNNASQIDDMEIVESESQSEQIETPINKTPKLSSAQKIQMQKPSTRRQHLSKSFKSDNAFDYAKETVSHTKKLKDAEHKRHMEMAEEEHLLKMTILREQSKQAEFETRTAEFRMRAAEFQMRATELELEIIKKKTLQD